MTFWASNNCYTINRRWVAMFLFLFVILTKAYSSDDKYLISVVDSETELPIEQVHAYLNNIPFGVSDEKGFIYVDDKLFVDSQSVFSFTCIGYKKKDVNFTGLKADSFRIRLHKENVQVGEAVVFGDNKMKTYIRYKTLSPLPGRIHSFSSIIHNDTLYVTGGCVTNSWNNDILVNSIYKYSIKSDKWIKTKSKLRRRASHSMHVYNNRIYLLGGITGAPNQKSLYLDNTIEVFDINSQEIKIDRTNPHEAANFLSVLKDDFIIMIGGSLKEKDNKEKINSKDIHLFNLRTGYWYKLGELDEGKEVRGTFVEDKIYLIGGHSFRDLDIIESYDLKTGEITVESRMPKSAGLPAVTSNGHDMIYIFNDGTFYTYNTIDRELKTYLADIILNEGELHYYNDKLYLLGGKTTYLKNPETNFEYNVSEGSSNVFLIDIEEFNTTRSINMGSE